MRISNQALKQPLRLSLVALLAGGLFACGGEDQTAVDTTVESTNGANNLEGTIAIAGSSTVYPITEAIAEEFSQEYPDVSVTVSATGTGGGFERFCAGQTAISNASRPIQQEEIEACEAAGIEFIEIPVAYDAVSVVTSAENDWLECLTTEELESIWAPEAQGQIDNWSQVRPDFPNEPIELYGPGTDSGTFDYFTDAIVGEEGASRGDYTASEDDNIIVQGVANNPNALGYFGLAYLEENEGILKPVAIDDGDPTNGEGCVLPSAETVDDGTYQPLARPIFIYIQQEALQRPEVQAFVDYYTQQENSELIADVGYVPLSDTIYERLQTRLENETTGSIFEGGSTVGVRLEEVL